MICEFLTLLSANLALALEIALVADQDAGDIISGVLLYLLHPVLDCAEGLAVCDIVGDDDAMSTFVVA